MGSTPANDEALFQVWLVRYEQWIPARWNDLPPDSIALELAEPEAMSAKQAANYLQRHNQVKLAEPDHRWAVAVPVSLIYEGALRQRQPIRGNMLQKLEESQLA